MPTVSYETQPSSSSISESSEADDELPKREIAWNTTTNVVPPRTRPTITLSKSISSLPITVTMICDVEGATIRYTLNGRASAPTLSSRICTGPFTIYEPSVIKACWYFNGLKSRPAKAVAAVIR